MIKILIVEDSQSLQATWSQSLANSSKRIQLLQALTLEKAFSLYDEHKRDIHIIFLDGCVPGSKLNTVPFISHVKASGFSGSLRTMSSDDYYQREMMAAGCTGRIEKLEVLRELVRIDEQLD